MKDFYIGYMMKLAASGKETQEACRKHWTGCLLDDIQNGRDTAHSTAMLAMIALAEEYGSN